MTEYKALLKECEEADIKFNNPNIQYNNNINSTELIQGRFCTDLKGYNISDKIELQNIFTNYKNR